MRRYGCRKASSTSPQTHGAKKCGTCAAFNQVPNDKSHRAHEKKIAVKEIKDQTE